MADKDSWWRDSMPNHKKDNEKLLEINEYYHDNLDEALGIMHRLHELDLKYNIKLPQHIDNDINNFINNFRFQYHDR